MEGQKPLLKRFSTRIDLFALAIFVVFAFLIRPVREIQDIAVSGDYIYLALGDQGIRVVHRNQTGKLTEVGKYKTFDTANGLAIRKTEEKERLFVADGKSGLLVFEINDRGNPQYKWDDGSYAPAKDIALKDGYALIARGKNGLSVVNIESIPPSGDKKDIEIENGALSVVVEGNRAYVLDKVGTLHIFNIDSPKAAEEVGSFIVEDDVNDLFVQNGIAYLATKTRGLLLLSVSDPQNVSVLSESANPDEINGIFVYGGFAYVGAGLDGLQILDISEPRDPVKIKEIDEVYDARKLIRVGDYIYVEDYLDGLNALKFDLSVDIDLPSEISDMEAKVQGLVEDVAIVDGRYIYLAGGKSGLWGGSISEKGIPEDFSIFPEIKGYVSSVASWDKTIYIAFEDRGLGILAHGSQIEQTVLSVTGKPKDIAVYDPSYAYIASGEGGLNIVDINPANPAEIGFVDTPGNAKGVFALEDHAYIADGEAGLQIIDISNRSAPVIVSAHDTDVEAQSVVVAKSGGKKFAYIADRSGGVAVIEVTNPTAPRFVTTIETKDSAQDLAFDGEKNLLYVTDSEDGIITFDIANPENPIRKGNLPTPGTAVGIILQGNFGYIADGKNGLQIINLEKVDAPTAHSSFDMPSQAKDIEIKGRDQAFMVDGDGGLWIFDLSSPSSPKPVKSIVTPGKALQVTAEDGKAFVADGDKGVQVVDISDPNSASIIESFPHLNDVRDIAFRDNNLYIANGGAGMDILSISDAGTITQTGHYDTKGYALNIDLVGDRVFVVSSNGRIEIVNTKNPKTPVRVQEQPSFESILGDTKNIQIVDSHQLAFISDGVFGIKIIYYGDLNNLETIFEKDTPGNLQDVAITDNFVFLADGTGGIEVFYRPEIYQFQPMGYFSFTEIEGCEGNAQSIAVLPHYVVGNTVRHMLFVAADKCGLVILAATPQISLEPMDEYITPGDASIGSVARGYGKALFRTIGDVWASRSEKRFNAIMLPRITYEKAVDNFGALHPRIKDSALLFLFGLILPTFALLFWLSQMAFFVLPVKSPADGWYSFWRLFLYWRGMHGPIVFAKEGKEVISDSDELKPGMPGILRVDLNSAAVLEEFSVTGLIPRLIQSRIQRERTELGQPLFQTRAVKPGVMFTRAHERVRGVADLRPQFRGRRQVHAYTREGIEVYSRFVFANTTLGERPKVVYVTYDGTREAKNIRVIEIMDDIVVGLHDFLDDGEKGEIHDFVQNAAPLFTPPAPEIESEEALKTPFDFDEVRVKKAIDSKPYDVDDKEIKEWQEFPAHVAAGLYRDILGVEFFDHIFKPADPDDFPLKLMKPEFIRKMQYMGILAFQYVENRNGRSILLGQKWDKSKIKKSQSRELTSPKPLRDRGVKIRFAGFSELVPKNRNVSRQLREYWQAKWQKDAMLVEADHDRESMRLRDFAKADAQVDLVNTIAKVLSDKEYSQEALALQVLRSLESASADPATQRLLPKDTIQLLKSIHTLLLPGDQQPPDDEKESDS